MDLWCNLWFFVLGLGRLLLQTCIGLQWLIGMQIYVLVMFLLSFLKCPFIIVGSYWLSYLWPCTLLCKYMLWWVKFFCVYPPLDMVHWFFAPPFVFKEIPNLLVLSPLLYVLPLEVHQFFSGGIETRLTFFLEIPTVFRQFFKWRITIWMWQGTGYSMEQECCMTRIDLVEY